MGDGVADRFVLYRSFSIALLLFRLLLNLRTLGKLL